MTALISARLQIHALADTASKLPGLTDIERAQMRAITSLAGLHLHELPVVCESADAERQIDDMFHIAAAADQLISAIGRHAKFHFSARIDAREFEGQLWGALDGNATFALRRAGEEADEALREEVEAM